MTVVCRGPELTRPPVRRMNRRREESRTQLRHGIAVSRYNGLKSGLPPRITTEWRSSSHETVTERLDLQPYTLAR
ncbi:hypothetical protein EVAR_36185_1 [Eumeta japonica]|uniref:Uncharacterized protein n=1 Tax=Eumeta variegata TaxID=151549 RepID=A0A4C1VTA5_EUMVA|nr:hypothetical protein EVAR_36185_1 [Eumeta japonica]